MIVHGELRTEIRRFDTDEGSDEGRGGDEGAKLLTLAMLEAM